MTELLDSTLREGELTNGVAFSLEQKIDIALALDEFGVDFIEVGQPAVSDSIKGHCKKLCSLGLHEANGLAVDEGIVDSVAMRLVTRPRDFDVIVTTNLFGDILSDVAAGVCGGLGAIPSGSYGEACALFEPVHGSAPDIAGRGIADPRGSILSAAMMLEHLGKKEKAKCVRDAVEKTGFRGTTRKTTDAIIGCLA